jgi:hypothetical protein
VGFPEKGLSVDEFSFFVADEFEGHTIGHILYCIGDII